MEVIDATDAFSGAGVGWEEGEEGNDRDGECYIGGTAPQTLQIYRHVWFLYRGTEGPARRRLRLVTLPQEIFIS